MFRQKNQMTKSKFTLSLIAISLSASVLNAFAQTPVPRAFTSLNEIELAKRCYYMGDLTGRLIFQLWRGKNNDNAIKNMANTATVTEVWRSKFNAEPSSDEMVLTIEHMNIEPLDAQNAQANYCTAIGRNFYDLMTPAQQKSLLDKVLKRVAGYKTDQP